MNIIITGHTISLLSTRLEVHVTLRIRQHTLGSVRCVLMGVETWPKLSRSTVVLIASRFIWLASPVFIFSSTLRLETRGYFLLHSVWLSDCLLPSMCSVGMQMSHVSSVQYWRWHLTACPNLFPSLPCLSHRVWVSRRPVEAHFTSSQSASHDAPTRRRQAAGQRPRLLHGQPRGQWVHALFWSTPLPSLSLDPLVCYWPGSCVSVLSRFDVTRSY